MSSVLSQEITRRSETFTQLRIFTPFGYIHAVATCGLTPGSNGSLPPGSELSLLSRLGIWPEDFTVRVRGFTPYVLLDRQPATWDHPVLHEGPTVPSSAPSGTRFIARDKLQIDYLSSSFQAIKTFTLRMPLLVALADSSSFLSQPSMSIDHSAISLLSDLLLESRPSWLMMCIRLLGVHLACCVSK